MDCLSCNLRIGNYFSIFTTRKWPGCFPRSGLDKLTRTRRTADRRRGQSRRSRAVQLILLFVSIDHHLSSVLPGLWKLAAVQLTPADAASVFNIFVPSGHPNLHPDFLDHRLQNRDGHSFVCFDGFICDVYTGSNIVGEVQFEQLPCEPCFCLQWVLLPEIVRKTLDYVGNAFRKVQAIFGVLRSSWRTLKKGRWFWSEQNEQSRYVSDQWAWKWQSKKHKKCKYDADRWYRKTKF